MPRYILTICEGPAPGANGAVLGDPNATLSLDMDDIPAAAGDWLAFHGYTPSEPGTWVLVTPDGEDPGVEGPRCTVTVMKCASGHALYRDEYGLWWHRDDTAETAACGEGPSCPHSRTEETLQASTRAASGAWVYVACTDCGEPLRNYPLPLPT